MSTEIPPSYEVAREMFEAAPPGSPELDEATTLCVDALVRRVAWLESEEDE